MPTPLGQPRGRSAAGFGALLLGFAATSALAAGIGIRLSQTLPGVHGAVRVDQLVEPAVLVVGAALAGWLAGSFLVALLCATARLVGGTWRAGEQIVARSAPGLVRRSLAVVVTAGLGVAFAGGAQAADPVDLDLGWVATAPAPSDAPAPAPATTSPTAASVPVAAPTTAPARATPPAAAPTPASAIRTTMFAGQVTADGDRRTGGTVTAVAPDTPTANPASGASSPSGDVVVQPGDSLWRIAASELPPGATDTEIDAAWRAWFAANADVVGADPDLITPGQVLQRPAGSGSGGPTPTSLPTSTTDGAP